MREFFESKWGDLIGWEILHVGIAIAVWGAVTSNAQLAIVGGGLMNAGFVALKLRSPSPAGVAGLAPRAPVDTAHHFTEGAKP